MTDFFTVDADDAIAFTEFCQQLRAHFVKRLGKNGRIRQFPIRHDLRITRIGLYAKWLYANRRIAKTPLQPKINAQILPHIGQSRAVRDKVNRIAPLVTQRTRSVANFFDAIDIADLPALLQDFQRFAQRHYATVQLLRHRPLRRQRPMPRHLARIEQPLHRSHDHIYRGVTAVNQIAIRRHAIG